VSSDASFAHRPDSVRRARRFAVDALRGETTELVERVELMVSELATNAIVHAGAPFAVAVTVGDRQVRVEVADGGAGEPTVRDITPASPSGRGLHIVGSLADAWGVDDRPDGKTVWFVVERTPGDAAAPAERTASGVGPAPGGGVTADAPRRASADAGDAGSGSAICRASCRAARHRSRRRRPGRGYRCSITAIIEPPVFATMSSVPFASSGARPIPNCTLRP
jgi:anti-sigma regulatory factor (Ser/Thr protein kinase)